MDVWLLTRSGAQPGSCHPACGGDLEHRVPAVVRLLILGQEIGWGIQRRLEHVIWYVATLRAQPFDRIREFHRLR